MHSGHAGSTCNCVGYHAQLKCLVLRAALPSARRLMPSPAVSCLRACRAFPDAFTVRCFAFEPSDEQIAEDRKRAGNFIMFPPGATALPLFFCLGA